jgi:dTDP-4-amino-4,6-dideoxygalactose transaminase
MHVPLLDLRLQYAPLRDAIRAEFDAICDAQAFVLGPKVEAFERDVEAYLGAGHAIAVSSGTDAQLVLMMALGIGAGDAVITTPYTFFATAGCATRLGATLLFADIDPATYNIRPEAVARLLELHPNVKAILPVHLFGCCAALEDIVPLATERGIPVLEDAAQALGARHPMGAAGAICEAGWFSFYPTKNLGAFGDAGMVWCRDSGLAERVRMLRNHGMQPRYFHPAVGGNFRMDALQAAVLRIKLPHLDGWSDARASHAALYRALFLERGLLDKVTLPVEPYTGTGVLRHHIYNQFVIRVSASDRDALREALKNAGVGTEIYYPLPLHRQDCYARLGLSEGSFPEAERAARETLALPIFPELTEPQIRHVVGAISAYFARA